MNADRAGPDNSIHSPQEKKRPAKDTDPDLVEAEPSAYHNCTAARSPGFIGLKRRGSGRHGSATSPGTCRTHRKELADSESSAPSTATRRPVLSDQVAPLDTSTALRHAHSTPLSLASLISQRTSDALSGRRCSDTVIRHASSFFEECLNPLSPMHKVSDTIPDSFASFSQYLGYFDPLRANENICSVRTSVFENSRYRQATVHSADGIVCLRTQDFVFEHHDILYFSQTKTHFKTASMSFLANDLENGSFLGIVVNHSDLSKDLVQVQVSAGTKHLRRGQQFFYRYAGNIITSLREYNALLALSSNKLLRYVLRPSFLADFMDRRVLWDSKRREIVVGTAATDYSHSWRANESMQRLEDLLVSAHRLNTSQARAVSESFYSKERFFLIQGPPGTGKTTTILSIISVFLLLHKEDPHVAGGSTSSKRILVCAPSNTAVDVVVLRIAKGLQGFSGETVSVPVIRVGYSASSMVSEYTLEHLVSAHPPMHRGKARSNLLAGASVVCTTLSSSASECMNGVEFDLLIVDEACQSTEISTLVPLRHSPGKVIMIGDPCQLPPTVISDQPQLKRSLFERMLSAHQPALLNTQYRMHEEICGLCSHFFYSDMLRTSPDIDALKRKERGCDVLLGCSPVNFIDVHEPSEKVDEFKSYYNPAEASVCCEICKRLGERYGNKLSVVILSPYKAQVTALKSSSVLGELGVEASTIDAFQGREADVVILSAVRQTGLGFTGDFRRINVAITRSRECLIILGSSSCLRQNPLWSRILSYVGAKSGFFDFSRRLLFLKSI